MFKCFGTSTLIFIRGNIKKNFFFVSLAWEWTLSCVFVCSSLVQSRWNMMAHRDARERKWREKLENAVGSQYSSHCLGTWCIQHYYRWCAHLGCQQSTELTPPADLNGLVRLWDVAPCILVVRRVQLKPDGTRWRTGGEVKGETGEWSG
jgi:hypothetical protein